MLFWKKQKKKRNTKEKNVVEQKEELQKIIMSQEKLAKDIEQMLQKAKDEQNDQLLKILNIQEQLQKSVRKNTESIEDLADIMEEASSSIEDNKQTNQIEKNTDLCNLLSICMEQLYLLEDALSGDSTWNEQFTIMDQKRNQYERQAGVQQIGYPGEMFDYHLHEILQTEDTEEKAKEGIIAKRYAPGFVYKGEVIKKAKVSVYRRKQHE